MSHCHCVEASVRTRRSLKVAVAFPPWKSDSDTLCLCPLDYVLDLCQCVIFTLGKLKAGKSGV